MNPFEVEEVSINTILAALTHREISVVELVTHYLARISSLDANGPMLSSILEVNPHVIEEAETLDVALRNGKAHGALHGVPVLVKDNIDTAAMRTTAGSLALVGAGPKMDARVVRRLREAGAMILGKTNLSEWANFRSPHSTSGWSARGGQTRNPYALDRSPCGSSSGSAVAVAANLAMASLGTETHGSVVCPSSVCGVVGFKPTVGLTSREGVIPISRSQDSVGIHARSVEDAVRVLGVIAESPDVRSALSEDLRPHAIKGARLGVLRQQFAGYHPGADRLFESGLTILRASGALLRDPAILPSADELRYSKAERTVLKFECHAYLDEYLRERGDADVGSLADLIAFNKSHAEDELTYFGQETLEASLATGDLSDANYVRAREECIRLGAIEGIDAALNKDNLDALVALTTGPAWIIDPINGDHRSGSSCQPAAMAGYPMVTVPLGFVANQLPVGITFIGRAHTDSSVANLAYGFERHCRARRAPDFLPTVRV